MVVQCEKDLNIEELIKDLDTKSKKAPVDPKNSYVISVNRQLLADARDALKHYYTQEIKQNVSTEV